MYVAVPEKKKSIYVPISPKRILEFFSFVKKIINSTNPSLRNALLNNTG